MSRLLFAAALIAVAYMGGYAAAALDQQIQEPVAICETDLDCMAHCPEGTADLPPDHPDYCDGGPQS